MNPLISVVIPHKNSSKMLKRLLDTIPEDPLIETVVVDDQSSRSEKSKIIEICKSNQFVRLTFNKGPEFNAGVARNIALSYIKGQWVFFADSDDKFMLGAFDNFKSEIEENSKSDVILFPCCSLTEDGEKGERADRVNALLDDYPNNKEIILYKWLVPWGKLIRFNVLRNNNIVFDSCIASNDVMFSTRLAKAAKRITVSKNVVYCCFSSFGSLTSTIDEAKALSRLNALVRRNKFLIKNHVNIKRDFGGTFFLKSKPWLLSKSKLKCYLSWFASFINFR